MNINEIKVNTTELTEEKILDSMYQIIDIILGERPSKIKKSSVKKIFRKKMKRENFTNDGIWYEVHHNIIKDSEFIEKFDLKTLEKIETGIDLLSVTNDRKILFSEMKSSISSIEDYKLFCEGMISQFTKNSFDVAQFSEFTEKLLDLNLINTEYDEKIAQLIDDDSYDIAIAKDIILSKDNLDLFKFELLIATQNILEEGDFLDKIERVPNYTFSRSKRCKERISNDTYICKKCIEPDCVDNIISKLENYVVTRNHLDKQFDLENIYKLCLEYVEKGDLDE